MTVYDKIKLGLEEAIRYERGEVTAKTVRRSLSVAPVKQWSAAEIKQIRHTTGMPQKLFAKVVGVSPKTVEAWEAGRNTPAGPAGRMLAMFQQDPNLAEKYKIVINKLPSRRL